MSGAEVVNVTRDCMAMMVPSGARIMLHQGTEVVITQALGNSFTVNVFGNLARIDAKDADALGKEAADPFADLPEGASVEDKVKTLLKTVYDPEIPVNIVDLGLVYACDVQQKPDGYYVIITMTLTAPGCGMGPVIAGEVEYKIGLIEQVAFVKVDLVFDPPWDRSMLSEEAKLQLGMF